jgi:hypothetical protein
MKLKGIFALVMLGLAVPGKTAQVLDQSLASQESRKVRQQKVEPFSEADRAETGSVPLQAQPQIDLQTFSLSSGTSIDVSESWIEREQMPLPPSPRLARFAPDVTFLEFMALENPKTHSLLRIATTTNPFLGGDEVALDTQMRSAADSGDSLADYLFYFFYSPPRDCLDGGSEAFTKARSKAELSDQTTVPADLSIRTDCKHAHNGGFLFQAIEPGRGISIHDCSGAGQRNFPGVLFDADGKSGVKWAYILCF